MRDGGDIDPRHSKNRGDSQYCGSDVSKWQDSYRYEHTIKAQKACMQELTFRRDFDGTSTAPMPPTTTTTRPAPTTTTTKPPTTTTTRKPNVTSLASAGWQKAKPKLTPEEAGAVSRAQGECNGVDVCVWDITLKAGFDHLASSICAKAAEAIKAEGVVFGSRSEKYDGTMNNVAIHSPTKVTPIHNCR